MLHSYDTLLSSLHDLFFISVSLFYRDRTILQKGSSMRNHFYAFAALTLMMKRLSRLSTTPSLHSLVDDYNQLSVYQRFFIKSLRVSIKCLLIVSLLYFFT